ncbi:hypothetical protein [Microbacterium testaceum]|uniref:hypothetical protein n=1 Tax=Microbacterium testaceum TaxID=2033 RepID=UPI000733D0C4|nr:hypothetical protein [Microbacterium testaceum]KTS02463.1 hypothetical protein NS283_14680 [Microbacterium testaceum]
MTEHAEGARSRSAREVLPNLLAGLWAIAAASLVWWSGVELWREVTPCAPQILLATVVLTWGILFMAVGAGAVPALVARMTGALWLPWLALLPSLAVLGLYAMIMISATSFGLSEHPDRVPAAIPDIFVSFAPSVALVVSNLIAFGARRGLRRTLIAWSTWAVVIASLALLAALTVQSAC